MGIFGIPVGKERDDLKRFSEFLDKAQLDEVRRLISKKKAGVFMAVTKATIVEQSAYPQLNALDESPKMVKYIQEINDMILDRVKEQQYQALAQKPTILYQLMLRGSDVDGPERSLAKAATLQLFSPSRLHLLVLTDDESFRDILMGNMKSCAPISALYTKEKMNRLVMFTKGKGLLPETDEGIFIMGEFRCDKKEEREPILSAMQQGYVLPEKKGPTPSGMKLITSNLDILHTQVPFDRVLIHEFHLVFIMQRKNKHHMPTPSLRINMDDIELVRGFVSYCKDVPQEFPQQFNETVTRAVHWLKEHERHAFVDVTGKTADAIKALACSRAMMHLRPVEEDDVKEAIKIAREALFCIGAREAAL
jgi:hypothetical protein